MYLLLILIGSILFVFYSGAVLKWHPVFSLITVSLGFGLLAGLNPAEVIVLLSSGFGNLVGAIGLIIVFGSILGTLLEQSGSVQIMGEAMQRWAVRSPSLGVAFCGMILGIPVFCDSGFIILISLAKSIGVTANIPIASMSLSLAGGLYTTHTLVPPTPGPVAAAGNLGLTNSLGIVMILGIVISIPIVIVAHAYAKYIGRKIKLPDTVVHYATQEKQGSILRVLFLLILPVLLISFAAIANVLQWKGSAVSVITFMGNPIIALLLTVAVSLFFFRQRKELKSWIETGIKQAGPILLLTGCGGSFGAVLKASELTPFINSWVTGQSLAGVAFIVLGFAVSSLFKIAQGSSTSAMIIVSSILAPLAVSAGFADPISLSLLVLAIGAGAMTVSHANDSYFWVVAQFTGMDIKSAYKSITIMTLLQGLTALVSVILIYWLLV